MEILQNHYHVKIGLQRMNITISINCAAMLRISSDKNLTDALKQLADKHVLAVSDYYAYMRTNPLHSNTH